MVNPRPLLRTLFLHRAGLTAGGAESLKTVVVGIMQTTEDLRPREDKFLPKPRVAEQGEEPKSSSCWVRVSSLSQCCFRK